MASVTVTRLGDIGEPIPELPGVAGDCVIGNAVPPTTFHVLPWFEGTDIAYSMAPRRDCQVCPLGFRVLSIHLVIQAEGPMAGQVSGGLQDVSNPLNWNCPGPPAALAGDPDGNLHCNGGGSYTIEEAGVYDVTFSINCGCVSFAYAYALVSYLELPLSYGLDAQVAGCNSYFNLGHGTAWQWEPDAPGDLVLYAEVECCEPPVSDQGSSWGSVKALFDD